MSSHPPILPFPIITMNATTVGPAVTFTVTPDPGLHDRTLCGVYQDSGRTLRVYRWSDRARGNLSCEIYQPDQAGAWRFCTKEECKFAPPASLFPEGAKTMTIDGVPCASYDEFTPADVELVRSLVSKRPA